MSEAKLGSFYKIGFAFLPQNEILYILKIL